MKFECYCLFFVVFSFNVFHYTLTTIKCDDKLTLGPVQLMDLILKEQPELYMSDEFKSCAAHQPARKLRTNIVSDLDSYLEAGFADDDEDNELLSGHEEMDVHIHHSGSAKVWSDWSEWSKCNATCGAGVSSRRRVCVAGDCAPLEWEQRIRSCSNHPC